MRRKRRLIFLAGLLLISAIVAVWLLPGLAPVGPASAPKIFIRYEDPVPLDKVLSDLAQRGILKSSQAAKWVTFLAGGSGPVAIGSYSVGPGQNALSILLALRKPIHQTIRLPETNWANRSAHVLEQHNVTSADEYMEIVRDPGQIANEVSFPLPKDSLEGYLYPGRYDLPPLFGAKRTILKQLEAFEKNIWPLGKSDPDFRRTLILASLVQLEAGKDSDRPIIAGVIENRIKARMPLQIDATIEYALQKWRRLTFKDYRNVKSPYNTYLIKGLPPGPICSPDKKDIEAAMHPAKHDYLFYVALPNGQTIYSATYKEHLKNIKKRRAAMKAGKS